MSGWDFFIKSVAVSFKVFGIVLSVIILIGVATAPWWDKDRVVG